MTNERFDKFLQQAAAEYHEPPETPRAEMWARIDGARAKRRGERDLEREARPWVRWGMGVAAVLVVGIGIGRVTVTPVVAPGARVALEVESNDSDAAEDARVLFQVVATDYLSQTDAFLTLFQTEARAGQADAEVTSWARDLLATARLMIDSPIADNPNLRELLEDLEVILVQISQYASNQSEAELDLIEQGLEARGVQPRLQAALTWDAELMFAEGAM